MWHWRVLFVVLGFGWRSQAKIAVPLFRNVEWRFLNASWNHSLRGPKNKSSGLDINICVVDSFAAFFYLHQLSLSLATSVVDCDSSQMVGQGTQVVCVADIWGVIQSLFNSVSYIAGLVSQCQPETDAGAVCAANTLAFVGDMGEFFQGALSIATTCGQIGRLNVNPRTVENISRRLESDKASENNFAESYDNSGNASQQAERIARRLGTGHSVGLAINDQNAAWCYVDTASSAIYVAQAANNIATAVGDCAEQRTAPKRQACASDLAATMASLMDVIGYIGGAASLCSRNVSLPALCAGDVGTIGNALGGVAATSAVLQSSCQGVSTKPEAMASFG